MSKIGKKGIFALIVIAVAIAVITISFITLSARTAVSICVFCIIAGISLPFFVLFEKGKFTPKKIMLLAVMTSLSVVSRMIFAPLPHFKPVTAMTIISGVYLGPVCGFISGALTALISNFYFGQGLFTPYQMVAWGTIGLVSALLSKPLKKSLPFTLLFAAISGIFYSLVMDLWTVIGMDDGFNLARYAAAIISSAPITLIYCISNVVFSLILFRPIGKKLDRVMIKFGE